MNNELVLSHIAAYLSNLEIFQTYRQLTCVSRSMWTTVITPIITNNNMFEVLASSSRLVWLDYLISQIVFRPDDLFQKTTNGDTIVHKCARKGDSFSVFLLIFVVPGEKLFDPNCVGGGGMTILHCAAASRDPKLGRLLVNFCDANIRDDIGRLAEDWAGKQQSFELVELLQRSRRRRNRQFSPPPSVSCFSFLNSN